MISRVILKNWRNFRSADAQIGQRCFLVGPNGCGKSNFLDVFRFLKDISKPGGGLQSAVESRGGLSDIRCLAARSSHDVETEIHLSDTSSRRILWKYAIGVSSGHRHPYLTYEKVWKADRLIMTRPDKADRNDDLRLTQTHLEQIIANAEFREISDFLASVSYFHIVPQMIRYPGAFSGPGIPEDPFGRRFTERIAKTPDKVRKARMKKIEEAIRFAVPQMKTLAYAEDMAGIPHLETLCHHWRPGAVRHREDQFSDGTLRLTGFLWSLMENSTLLLSEEPELSLDSGVVRKLPALIYRLRMQNKHRRQIILSTHSPDLLSDPGIGGEEVLLITPGREGSEIRPTSSVSEIRDLLEGGLSVSDAVLPYTMPENIHKLELVK